MVTPFDNLNDIICQTCGTRWDKSDDEAMRYFRSSSNALFIDTGQNGMVADSKHDNAQLPAGDLDMRIKVDLTDYSSPDIEILLYKALSGAATTAYYMRLESTGKWRSTFADDQPTPIAYVYEAPPLPSSLDGNVVWLRSTWDLDNGAGGHTVTWLYSIDNGVTWVQHHQLITAGTIGVVNSYDNAPLVMGCNHVGALPNSKLLTGEIYRVLILDGIEGTTIFDADFNAQPIGTTTFLDRASNLTIDIGEVSTPYGVADDTEIRQGRATYASYGSPSTISLSGEAIIYCPSCTTGHLAKASEALGGGKTAEDKRTDPDGLDSERAPTGGADVVHDSTRQTRK